MLGLVSVLRIGLRFVRVQVAVSAYDGATVRVRVGVGVRVAMF